MSAQFTIEQDPRGGYQVTTNAQDGEATIFLDLREVESLSGGRLDASSQTARATFEVLLEHQDAADLPPTVQFADVVASYPDAVDAIAARRG